MLPSSVGNSAFASSLTTSTKIATLLTWLEDELCAERQLLDLALKDRHQALFKEMALQLEAVAVDCKSQWPCGITSVPIAGVDANPGIKSIKVQDGPLTMPHMQRQRSPPTEPSSPASSFLRETESASDLDEYIQQTSALHDEDKDEEKDEQQSVEKEAANHGSRHTKHHLGGKPSLHYSISTLESKTQSHCYLRFMKMVLSNEFESVFSALIILNTLFIAAEAQYSGFENGFLLGYHTYVRHPEDALPGAAIVFDVAEWCFGLAFTLQLVLSLICLKKEFFKEAWNIADAIIVGAWLVGVASSTHMVVDPSVLRLVRIVRLVRLLRIVRTVSIFDKLYLLTTSISASVSTLMWAIMVLLLFLVMMGLLLQKLAEPYVLDDSNPIDKRLQVFMYYGTCSRSMLTMFEMTLGNWMPPCRALVENVSEWFMLLFVAHKLVVGFSVVSVINAVIVQETFKVATSDDRVMLMAKKRSGKTHHAKIVELFKHADADGDGALTRREMRIAFSHPDVQSYVSALDLNVDDAANLFAMLDTDNDDLLSLAELSAGMLHLRGAATNYDVQRLLRSVEAMSDEIEHLNRKFPSDVTCTMGSLA